MKTGIGYPIASSYIDAAKFYAKVRKNEIRTYILADTAPELQSESCAHCRRKMNDPDPALKGNRALYSPKHKKSVVLHYICSWESLMQDIYGRD